MDFAVLVKAVPPVDELRFDPVRRTVIRDGTDLYLNPFDQRAIRVALQLRKPGERLTVLSMGPPAARGPLRDARAMGVDRVVLLSDPRLAGSDTLATARALARALLHVGHDLVLTGTWTTDSETGQVAPELAALLEVPVLTGARGMGRDIDGPGIVVTVDTPTGWASYAVRAPLVVSVGEKILKPGKVTPEEREAVPDSAVESWDLDRVAIDASEVGTAGSPTRVEAVVDDAPHRNPVVLDAGSPEERVARAVEILRPRLADRTEAVSELPPLLGDRSDEREVLVLATDRSGHLAERALGLLSEVRRSLPALWPSAVWVGEPPDSEASRRLAVAGAVRAYLLRTASVPLDSRSASRAVGLLLDRRPRVAAGLFLSDGFGREVAAHLAAPRGLGLVGDAVEVRSTADGRLRWSKPSFGGRTLAEIASRTRPDLATVRPGVWPSADRGGSSDALDWTELAAPPLEDVLRPFDSGEELPIETPTLDEREVVVSIGMGLGGPDRLGILEPLLARWDAALGATRKVVDAGWVPRQSQIGLTGHAPAPRLGVLLGVGGSTNHLVGWRRARTLLAVNSDPAAPVFREVDVGIVGTVEEIVPRLTEALAPLLGR
jgi:electron transfer flavoprotein alpha subunit